MGWGSGSRLLDQVWGRIQKSIPDESKPTVLAILMDEFEDADCDTVYEVLIDLQDQGRDELVQQTCDLLDKWHKNSDWAEWLKDMEDQ